MPTRIVRLIYFVLLTAAGVGAVAWTWTLAQHVEGLEGTARATAARIDRTEELLDRFADQELAFVSSGTTDARTLAASADQLRQLLAQDSDLLAHSLAGASTPAGAVADASATIGQILSRAHENLTFGFELMAADLIFTETAAARRELRAHLRALRSAEADSLAEARTVDLQRGWIAFAIVAVLVAWTLLRWSRAPRDAAPPLSVTAPPETVPVETSARQEPPELRTTVPVNAVDLEEAAALCTAIGQLDSDRNLQELIARTGDLLGAPGVVLWMAAGEELFAAAGHGYDSALLHRLGPIARSDVNATAAAWRTGQLQVVPGDATSSRAAIVAPMLGPLRCVGVLAVEVPPGLEADASTRAVTAMVAAQLAAVLTAWPAGSSSPAPADVLPFDRAAGATS